MEKYKNSPVRHYQAVVRYAGKADFSIPDAPEASLSRHHTYIGVSQVTPSEAEIREIPQRQENSNRRRAQLRQLRLQHLPRKAIAVYHGKADISKCCRF
jgi:hypothetical protein